MTYTDNLASNPPTPSHDANDEIRALLTRSNDRYNAFRKTAYSNGLPENEWQHHDRVEMLLEAEWCESRAQTLAILEQTKLLASIRRLARKSNWRNS